MPNHIARDDLAASIKSMIPLKRSVHLRGQRNLVVCLCWIMSQVACIFDSGVADAVQIRCTTNKDCPPTLVCNSMAGLCAPANEGDGTGPQIVDAPEIIPASASVGQEVEIRFRVSESLLGPPFVFLMSESEQKPFALHTQAVSANETWIFRYTVDGSEPQGQVPIGVSMVGTDGDAVAGLFAGNLKLDFRAPRVSDVLISPQKARIGQSIEVSFLPDENVSADDVRVWMQSEDVTAETLSFTLLERAASEPGTQWKFTYMPQGQEFNGHYELWFESRDAAGNLRTIRHNAQVVLDFFAPIILTPSQVEELPPLSSDDDLRVEILLDETALPTPFVRARSVLSPTHELTLDALQGNGEAWTYSGRFAPDMAEGMYEIFISGLRDDVGNESEDSLLYKVRLDNTPPTLSLFSPTEVSVQAGSLCANVG